MNLTFNSCKQCGSIRENVTIKLNQLMKKLDQKRYVLEHGYPEERMSEAPTKFDLWEWTQEIKKILGEI